jgi:hypothetical protein
LNLASVANGRRLLFMVTLQELEMMNRMAAEILFLNPDDVNAGVAALVERGFEVKVLDWIDPYGPTIWIDARVTTDVGEDRFLDWAQEVVGPLGGDVIEAGLDTPLSRAVMESRSREANQEEDHTA